MRFYPADKKNILVAAGISTGALLITSFLFLYLLSGGMVVGSDSFVYLNSAANLLGGNGISIGAGSNITTNTHWAPGYSLVLSTLIGLGIDWITAATIVNSVCYFFMLTGVGLLVRQITGSFVLALLAETAVGFHPVILGLAGCALSEPLSWVFVVIINILLFQLVRNPQRKTALCLGVALGCGVLVRYALVGFMAGTGLVIIILARLTSPRKALTLGSICLSIASVMPGLWLARNWLLTGRLDIYPKEGWGDLPGNILTASQNWWQIILGRGEPHAPWSPLIFIPLLVIGVTAVIRYRRFRLDTLTKRQTSERGLAYLVNFLLSIGYAGTLIVILTYVETFFLGSRKFSPLVIIFTIMMAACVIKTDPARKNLRYCGILVYSLWVALIVLHGITGLEKLKKRSREYFDWEASPTMAFASTRFKHQEIFTTDQEPFWLWHRIFPAILPFHSSAPLKSSWFMDKGARALIWFKNSQRPYLIQPDGVIWDKTFHKIEFNDGYIYSLP